MEILAYPRRALWDGIRYIYHHTLAPQYISTALIQVVSRPAQHAQSAVTGEDVMQVTRGRRVDRY